MAQDQESINESDVKQESIDNEEQVETVEEEVIQEKLFTVLEDVKQYGNASFDPEGLLNDERYPNLFSVNETNDTVEVIWLDTTTSTVNRSIAKNGIWSETDVELYKIEEGVLDTEVGSVGNDNNIVVVGRTVFYELPDENEQVKQISFDESGKIVIEKVISEAGVSPNGGFASNGDKAVITGGKLYLSSKPEEPIEVKDTYNLINQKYGFYIDLATNKLTFGTEIEGIKQVNISTGEPLYNENGEDATIGEGMDYERVLGGFDGNIIVSVYSGSGYWFSLYNENFQELASTKTEITSYKGDRGIGFVNATLTEDEIHIWRVEEFQRNQALRLWRIGKSVNGEPSE